MSKVKPLAMDSRVDWKILFFSAIAFWKSWYFASRPRQPSARYDSCEDPVIRFIINFSMSKALI